MTGTSTNSKALDPELQGLDFQLKLQERKSDLIHKQSQLPQDTSGVEMFEGMRQNVGYGSVGNEPWRGLLNGFFFGAGIAEKSKLNAKARESYDHYEKMLTWINANEQRAADVTKKAIERKETNDILAQSLSPIYLASFADRPREEIDAMGAKAFKSLQDRGIIDPMSRFAAIDPQMNTVYFYDANGEQKTRNYSEFISKETHDQVGELISKQNADTSRFRADTDAFYRPKELYQKERRNDIAQQNANTRYDALQIKDVKEILPRMESNALAIHTAENLVSLAEANPNIFGSLASAYLNTSGEAGAVELWIQQKVTDPKERDAIMEMNKDLSSLMLLEAKALGGQNNLTLDKWIRQKFPNGQYSQAVFTKIMKENVAKYKFYENMYKDTLNAIPSAQFIPQSYDRNVALLREEGQPTQPSSSPSQSAQGRGQEEATTIVLKDPDTGEKMTEVTYDVAKSTEVAQKRGLIVEVLQ